MKKLFMVYLGGSAPNANIELHDIQFVIGEDIESTYDQLKQNWFGNRKGLHLDSYKMIDGADGFSVSIEEKPQQTDYKLYFVNLGGYRQDKLTELHEFGLFVAKSADEAKRKAKAALLTNAAIPHKDNLMEVDDCIRIDFLNDGYIHLTPSDQHFNLVPDWFGYNVIG